MSVTRWHAELAWLGGDAAASSVLLEVQDGRFTAVRPDVPAPPEAVRLPGLTIPGLVNAHSHAFHRALRGRTHAGGAADFWAWRRQMYAVAERLDPDRYFAVARAVFAEMALAGITTVGEFHYLHHPPGGGRYAEPNAMGAALLAAAAEVGIRITLLDACYLQADVDGSPLTGVQRRFDDGDASAWADRVADLAGAASASGATGRVGVALHSVRAVPVPALTVGRDLAARLDAPLHLHLSEQEAENASCLAATGRTPAQLCRENGVLGRRTTAVHATCVTADDIGALGASGTTVCLCPTTERDLADGIGPAAQLAAAGSPLALGSDSQAVVDLLEEARAVEMDERLAVRRRGTHVVPDLLTAATAAGADSLGWPDAGRLQPGALADFVTVALDSPRTAGAGRGSALEVAVFAATAADVTAVVVGGDQLVGAGGGLTPALVGRDLAAALGPLWP